MSPLIPKHAAVFIGLMPDCHVDAHLQRHSNSDACLSHQLHSLKGSQKHADMFAR